MLRRPVRKVVDQVRRLNAARETPRATYRLQFHREFTFADATKLVPYLRDLGISHLYASPITRAVPGSMHGYDVIDQNELNPEIGTRAEFDRLVATLHRNGMGLIVDIVPNHMGIANGFNPWWQDVLENGRFSPFVTFFDIDWQPLKRELWHKVLLPVLGDQYGIVLERGELRLVETDGWFTVHYYETPLPIAPPTYGLILREALPALEGALDGADLALLEFQSILAGFERLPMGLPADDIEINERLREQTIGKERLRRLLAEHPPIRAALDEAIARINGAVGDPASFDALDRLLDAQSYRLAFWRVAAEEINYRRFFAINDLAAIRQEIPAVFSATHRLLMELIEVGAVDGVRVDHPDGLWDPRGYFDDLQRAAFVARCRAIWIAEQPADTWPEAEQEILAWWSAQADLPDLRSVYLVVEKILAHGEMLPTDWRVDGTVGYDFLSEVNGLQVDSRQQKAFDRIYAGFSGEETRFADMTWETRNLIMRVALTSEVNVLTNVLNTVSEHDRRTRDFTFNDLRNAMRSVIASFPIYRTYRGVNERELRPPDRAAVQAAIREAMRRNPAQDRSVFEFLRQTMLAAFPAGEPSDQDQERLRFLLKLQQLTGPVMAKGLEDTAFYRFNRMTALNEVGCEPGHFGFPADEIHAAFQRRQQTWPAAMLGSSTHDTKRSEDVRTRIAALSQYPRDWRMAINRWARLNRSHRSRVDGFAAPVRADEYLLYQTLLGSWPGEIDDAYADRIVQYMIKALREAQERSNWSNPNVAYEQAVERFVRAILEPARSSGFLDDFVQVQRRVAEDGFVGSLAAAVLKATSPGVPDYYQGAEFIDLSLVDPDNRRPVDFEARRSALKRLRARKIGPTLISEFGTGTADDLAKLHVIANLLQYRNSHVGFMATAGYEPITLAGPAADALFAFGRADGSTRFISIVPLRSDGLFGRGGATETGISALQTTTMPLSGAWTNLLTREVVERNGTIAIADLLDSFPVAVLVQGESE